MQGSRYAADIIIWRRFANKGYSAFASLHRVICIGVLSVSTLSVAAKAHGAPSVFSEGERVEASPLDDAEELKEVTVSASMAPLTQLQSARIVSVLTRQDIEQAAAQSVNDLLKLVTCVDVRQRGGFGIQTDISIDGGTFDQVTLLLNGIDIGNPQTGHLSADFPVGISDIERIEVLEGAASRVYGGQSFGGAINIVTKHERERSAELSGRGGSFGTIEGDARVSLMTGKLGIRISGGGGRSDGGTHNSSWQKGQLYHQGDYEDETLHIDWQFGYSRKSYGANTFYSANYPDQYERNQRLMVSVGAETKGRFHFAPHVFWNRSYDNFELIHGSTLGENFHRTDVYGIKVGSYVDWRLGKTAVLALMRHESILSTNLGRDLEPEQYVDIKGEEADYARSDNRTTVSFGLEHNVLLEHWTFSAGLMASTTSAIDQRFRFYPGIDVAYRPNPHWKILMSYNKGFRQPTFTELYYKSPTHEGNRDLKFEHNHSFSFGTHYGTRVFSASVCGFFHRGTRMIDWVMYSHDDVFHTAAFDLDNAGVQVQGRVAAPSKSPKGWTWFRSLSFGYTYIHQTKHDAKGVVKSNMAMEYLRHKLVVSLSHRIVSHLSMNWDFRWQERVGSYVFEGNLVPYRPYSILDAKLQWDAQRYQLYIQATNLTNHRYYDLGSVPQPGIWVMAGIRVKVI